MREKNNVIDWLFEWCHILFTRVKWTGISGLKQIPKQNNHFACIGSEFEE